MPNRIIREGWIDSERIESLGPHAETFFLRLCLKADDFGRFTANPQLLKSALYPLREDIRHADIACNLATAERAGLVRTYEVSSKRYLVIPDFRQRSRASSSKYPAPPDTGPPRDGQPPDARQSGAHVFGDVFGDGDEGDRAREGLPGVGAALLRRLGAVYGRKERLVPSAAEEWAANEIIRRPDWESELVTLLEYRTLLKAEDRRFFPQSVASLLAKWDETLDRANAARETAPKSIAGKDSDAAFRAAMAEPLPDFDKP